MEKDRKKKLINFTVEVLDFILNIPGSVALGFNRKKFYQMMSGFASEQQLTVSELSQIFSNLKNRGYVQLKQNNDQQSVVFTNKAKLALVDKIAERSPVQKKYYIVSFDIPEEKHIKRDKFRRTIKRLGFKQIQKSLWLNNKNVGDTVELAALEYGVGNYIVYFVSENTNINQNINEIMNAK